MVTFACLKQRKKIITIALLHLAAIWRTYLFSARSRINLEPNASNWKLAWERCTACGGEQDKNPLGSTLNSALKRQTVMYSSWRKASFSMAALVHIHNMCLCALRQTSSVCQLFFYIMAASISRLHPIRPQLLLTWFSEAWFFTRVFRSW